MPPSLWKTGLTGTSRLKASRLPPARNCNRVRGEDQDEGWRDHESGRRRRQAAPPLAGDRRGAASLRSAISICARRRPPATAATLAMDLAANGCGLVIAAGGDGTVSEVADGLINAAEEGSKAALGVLPCGTGTDFAKGLGLDPARGRLRGRDPPHGGLEGEGDRRRSRLLCRRSRRAGQPAFHQPCQPGRFRRRRPCGQRRREERARVGQGAVLLAHGRRVHPLPLPGCADHRRRRRADRGARRAGGGGERKILRRRHDARAGRCSSTTACSTS